MASKAPWRTVIMGGDTGRFTRKQINDAVEAVKARNEARAVRSNAGGKKRAGSAKPSGPSPSPAATKTGSAGGSRTGGSDKSKDAA